MSYPNLLDCFFGAVLGAVFGTTEIWKTGGFFEIFLFIFVIGLVAVFLHISVAKEFPGRQRFICALLTITLAGLLPVAFGPNQLNYFPPDKSGALELLRVVVIMWLLMSYAYALMRMITDDPSDSKT